MGALPVPRFSPEDYLEFDRRSEQKFEYLDGVIIAMAGGSPRHGMLAMRAAVLMGPAILANGCQPFSSDVRVLLDAKRAYAYPDFSAVCGPVECTVEYSETAWDTIANPSLIVEVLSASTATYDTGAKASLYHSISSLQDLLLIHQEPVWIEHHSRESANSWRIDVIQDPTATIHLRSLNYTLSVADIYSGAADISSQSPHE